MMAPAVQQHILDITRNRVGSSVSSLKFYAVGGGSINLTYRVETNDARKFFCKINSQAKFPGLFEVERQGLELLQAQKVIRIPHVIASTVVNDSQVLLMEWIEQGRRTAGFWTLLGQQLAALHSVEEKLFGLPADNYMGSLVQKNQQCDNWEKFFISQRLEPQIVMAVNGWLLSARDAAQFEKVYARLNDLFPFTSPRLLHGDLWSGNFLCDEAGRPVLIDPAVYYGHPAIDLAMTTLFGGFDKLFYESYSHNKSFPPNYKELWEVCNLYPLLIHLNLFGESYRSAILNTIRLY